MGDAVAQAVLSQFAALPKTGKPQPHEHTVLAGIAVQLPAAAAAAPAQPRAAAAAAAAGGDSATPADASTPATPEAAQPTQPSHLAVVALATGTKCLGASRRLAGGLALNDCHAEVLARRALLRWLYHEMVAAALAYQEQQRQRAAGASHGGSSTGAHAAAAAADAAHGRAIGSRVLRLVPPPSSASRAGEAAAGEAAAGEAAAAAAAAEGGAAASADPLGGWRFELLPGVAFHLFVSQPPCGDASILGGSSSGSGSGACCAAGWPPPAEGRTGAKPIAKRARLGPNPRADPGSTPAPPPPAAVAAPVEAGQAAAEVSGQQEQQEPAGGARDAWAVPQAGDVESYWEAQATGVVRRKPGKGEATLSMSCSDKLARWQLLGLQGSLLAGALAAPLRLASATVGAALPRGGRAGAGAAGAAGAVNSQASAEQAAAAVGQAATAVSDQAPAQKAADRAAKAGAAQAALRRALVERTAQLAAERLGPEAAAAAAALRVHAYLPPSDGDLGATSAASSALSFQRLGLVEGGERRVGAGSSVIWHAPPSASFRLKPTPEAQQPLRAQQQQLEAVQEEALPGAPPVAPIPLLLPGGSGSLEAVAGTTGLRVGCSRKPGKPIKRSALSCVCKAALWERWRQLQATLRALCGPGQPGRGSPTVLTAAGGAPATAGQEEEAPPEARLQQQQQPAAASYRKAKAGAEARYQAAWAALLAPPSPFEGWLPKPQELEEFWPDTDPGGA